MRLTLFLPRFYGLHTFDEKGTVSREVAIYNELHKRGMEIHFITYGKNDLEYQSQLPHIHIHTNRLMPDGRIYPRLIPLLHAPVFMKTDVIKTHQMLGAKFAIQAGQIYRKPVICRQGFMWSSNEASLYNEDLDHPRVKYVMQAEEKVWSRSAHIMVSSYEMKTNILTRIPEVSDKLTVIPNNIDETLFLPVSTEKRYDLIFVGRLSSEKNLFALLDAVKQLDDVSMLLIGDGPQKSEIRTRITEIGDRVEHREKVPNDELPELYNQARASILPSLFEGMPKVLLEAMSCGVPVIGTDVRGIREVIQHQSNGWLSEGTDADALKVAIETVLGDQELQDRLGVNARQTILDNYSLSKLAEKEHALIQDVVARAKHTI